MSQITIEQLTSTDPNTPGVFDVLMKAVEQRLQTQFASGRISGAEYANLYLGATTAVLQQSIQFLLTKEEAYQRSLLTSKEVELADKKILQTLAETANVEAQLGVIQKTALRTDAEIALLEEKKKTEAGQTTNISTGLVGKQQSLYDAQVQGFIHDTVVKSTKVVADIWSVQKSTDPDATDGLPNGTLQQVVDKMLQLGNQ